MAGFNAVPPGIRAAGNKAAVQKAFGGGPKPNAGPRQSAVAGHLGAPKAQSKAKPPAKPASHPQGVSKPQGFQLGQLPNKGQIHNEAVTQARLERRALLSPLEGQQRQIQANEASAQQQYGKLLGAENEQFQKLGEGAAVSAKTFENNAAEQALQQAKAIETTGQTQATMTGGYASPELRAQLAAGTQDIASQAGAQSQFAQNLATAGQNEIAQMRGAAALKGLGGSQALTNAFQKQSAKVGEEIGATNAKTAGLQSKIQNELAQRYFTDYATNQKLASEGVKLGLAKAATGSKIRHEQADAEYKRLESRWKIAGLEGTERQRAIDNGIKTGKLKVSELSAADKAKYDAYKEGLEPATKPNAEATKYINQVAGVESAIRAKLGKNLHNHAAQEKVRQELREQNVSSEAISAGFNLVQYGRLGPNDRKNAESHGVNKKNKSNWFR